MAEFDPYYKNVVLKWCGGFVDNPNDPGGATKFDVTLKTLAAFRKNPNTTVDDVRNMTVDEAEQICKEEFWDLCQGDSIDNQFIAERIVDWVWGSGPPVIRHVQEVLNGPVTGQIHDITLGLINNWADGAEDLYNKLTARQLQFIDDIIANNPKLEEFRRGWLNRINSIVFTDGAA